MAYRLGVSSGSIPIFDRRNSGVDAEIKVGRVEWRIVVDAIEKGNSQLGRDLRLAMIERGG